MARQRTAEHAVHLDEVPPGLAAHPVEHVRGGDEASDVTVRTRRGRAKLTLVDLLPARTLDATDVHDIPPEHEPFVMGATTRRWSTIEAALGSSAWAVAVALCRAGVVVVRCHVAGATRLGQPHSWRLTPVWRERCESTVSRRRNSASDLSERALVAADQVESLDRALAAALRGSRGAALSRRVLIGAAEDLTTGMVHAGPRAFAQAHLGTTKALDDVVGVLRGVGTSERSLAQLGLRRSDRIGIGGPIDVSVRSVRVPVEVLDGPALLRSDQPDLTLGWTRRAPLLVVENLQAAEAIHDRFPNAGLVYTAGVLSGGSLRLIEMLANDAAGVAICCDADAGGVRIAEQVLSVAPNAALVDAGAFPHSPRDAWGDGTARAGLDRALTGPAAALARACLERGYPVEQEAAIILAGTAALDFLEHGTPHPAIVGEGSSNDR